MSANQKYKGRKPWKKPLARKIRLDNSVSVLLASPPGDPPDPFKYTQTNSSGGYNPYK